MKKTFTILIAAIAAILMMALPVKVVGQTPTTGVYKQTTFNSTNNSAGVSSYSNSWYNTTSGFRVDITNANNANNSWEYIKIGSKNAAYTGTIITYAVIDKPVYSVTINIGNITANDVNSITLYKKSASDASWSSVGTFTKSSGKKTVTITSPTANLYYKIEASCAKASANGPLQINGVEFNVQTFTVTYDCAGGTNGPTSPATAFIGSYTVGKAPTRDGYSFLGWNDGTNTYAAGASYTISSAVTFTAQWQSLSSPNIVINGGTPIALAKGASGDQTATVEYNNMSGYSSPSVALFNDSGCTEEFNGGWFSANLSGDGKTTLNYSANANTVGERTVYIKVSTTYNEATITSVLAATQATSTRTVTYNANGGSGTTTDSNNPYNYGAAVNAVDNTFTAPSGKYFTNWSTTASGSGTSYDEGEEITNNITSDIELYARWADIPTYTRITSMAELVPGEHYIIVGTTNTGAWAMGKQTGSNTYRDADAVTVQTEDTDDDEVIDRYYVEASGLQEFVISGPTSSSPYLFTIYDESQKTNHYINANGGTSSNTINVIGTIENTSQFTITFDTKAIITANFTGKNLLSFNSSANPKRFSFYGSEQTALYLYKKDTKVGDPVNLNIYSATTLSNGLTVAGDMNIHAGVVTVPSAKTLTVTGTLTNSTAANLVIANGGQLVTANNASVSATVQKSVLAWNDTYKEGWNAISSPVNGQSFSGVANLQPTGDKTHNIYLYDPANVRWQEYRNNEAGVTPYTAFTNGRGYLYRKNNNTTIEFSGALNTGNVTYSSIYYDNADVLKQYNLIGNPYAHNITKGSSSANILNGDILESKYCIFNSDGTWTLTNDGTAIAPGTAILVQAKKLGSITITNAAGSKGETANNDNIWFTVAGNEFKDVACVEFKNGHGFNKIAHRNEDAPMLYINHNGENFASVDMDDETKVINLCFKSNKMGLYTLTYNAKGVFSYLHLIDKITGEDVDMLIDDEYTFVGTSSDKEDRFIVKLAYLPDYGIDGSDTFAFQSGNEIFVSGQGELQIFDVTGRFVMSERINGATSISADALSKGVYVLRIVGSEIKTQKIVVR